MHLLNPIGLIALAGLLIPLIIHLWKLKQGKTLRIGSIALLGAGSPFTSRSYQITDWLLLFLRMLLLALLAFLLAAPYRKSEAVKEGQKGWVLLEKADLPVIYKTQQKTIDSLIKAGYEMHDFGLKFQKISLQDTNSVTLGSTGNKLSHYALLQELNTQLHPDFPVYLYADQRLQNLGGDLPQVDFRLIWKEIKRPDTLNTWTSIFADKTFEVTSSPALTKVKRLDQEQGSSKISVLMYTADHPEDVKYLKSAILAIAQETKRNIEVVVSKGKIISDLKFDVGFWVSGKPVSSSFSGSIRNGGRLFNYEGDKVTVLDSWVDTEPEGKGNMPAILLSKRTTDSTYAGAKVWTDGFGIPLLTRTKEKTFDHYRFYSHINPQWTSLVWKEKFVEVMMPVLLGEDGADKGFGFESSPNDQRNSLLSFTPPSVVKASANKAKVAARSIGEDGRLLVELPNQAQKEEPLQKVFWLMALFVFTIERMISFRHKNKVNHG